MFQTIFGLNDRVYNFLKWFTTIVLPAFGAFYWGLADTWGLPNADQVVGTITLVVTFLGVLLGLSTRAYNNTQASPGVPPSESYDGEIMVDPMNPTEGTYVALDSSALEGKDVITLRVRDITSQ